MRQLRHEADSLYHHFLYGDSTTRPLPMTTTRRRDSSTGIVMYSENKSEFTANYRTTRAVRATHVERYALFTIGRGVRPFESPSVSTERSAHDTLPNQVHRVWSSTLKDRLPRSASTNAAMLHHLVESSNLHTVKVGSGSNQCWHQTMSEKISLTGVNASSEHVSSTIRQQTIIVSVYRRVNS